MNRLFDESFWDPFDNFFPGRTLASVSRTVFPKVDISETDNEVKIVADIPGIDPDKIEIEASEDTLSLSGKIEKESEEKEKKFYRFERQYGEFRREFALPAKVKTDAIEAKSKNGVLTIILPKAETEKKKKVKVETEK